MEVDGRKCGTTMTVQWWRYFIDRNDGRMKVGMLEARDEREKREKKGESGHIGKEIADIYK
jgi:hypothetical protein